MAAFEFLNSANESEAAACGCSGGKLKDECVISLKVYDYCRLQECLTFDDLGPARAATDSTYCDNTVQAGDVIVPPANANSVSVENLSVSRVMVVNKRPNPFRPGYWDVELKFIFVYRLVFRDVNGNELCSVQAQNAYINRMTMFGSITTETLVSTDLFAAGSDNIDLDADPFVLVESKGVSLAAEIHYRHCCCSDTEAVEAVDIHVTIGLFAIVKLFRLVNLIVQSKGFCIPDECEDVSSVDACEFFDNLDFPMDIFAPPQRAEFVAGVSSNIPADKKDKGSKGCGCGCGCK